MINALLLPNVPAVQQTSLPAPLELTAPPDGPIQPPGLTNTGATALPESSNHDATVHLPQHVAVEPTSTTDLARAALQRYQVIPVLVDSLTSPLPHGPDADQEIDSDYTEKAARTLVTYLEVCFIISSHISHIQAIFLGWRHPFWSRKGQSLECDYQGNDKGGVGVGRWSLEYITKTY